MDSIPPTPQHSQWNTAKTESIPRRPSPSSALNLLSLVATTKLEFFDATRLLLNQPAHHIVGTGAFSTVETGRTMDNRLVVVKTNKVLRRQLAPFIDETFEKHINQFCLEVRILTHSSLREHPNILQLYGICIDSSAGHPVLSLVLEYSSLGSLTSFLKAGQPATSPADRLDLILQAASGLEALHSVKVCHGDVKTQNALVFHNEGKLRLKLSDFGQSIVALQDDPSQVPVPPGTPLLNAPEIRKGSATGYSAFTIEDAITTDIYSFGLMTWEILKNGASFFDDRWVLCDSKNLSIDEKGVYLNSLTSEALYLHAFRFIETINLDSYTKNQISAVLRESLQEFPNKRASIATLANFLKPEELSSVTGTNESRHSTSDESILDLLFQPSLTAWTERQSMYDIYHFGLYNGFLVGKEYPISLRERILSELKLIATSNAIQDHACAHAALTVSECYTLGFGSNHDNKEVLYWLLEAAIRGCYKASLWYHRVCQAFGVEPVTHERLLCAELIEAHLYVVPTERYLLSRIHYMANSQWRQVLEATDMSAAKDLTGPTRYLVFGLKIFSSWELDNLLPLHFAAWSGDDTMVLKLLQNGSPHTVSTQNLTALHYSCLGGRLSTMIVLLDNKISASTIAFHDITPLHLSIFFHESDVSQAVNLLLQSGADPEAEAAETVYWEDHDIQLSGTAIDWAVLSRNLAAVKALLPHSSGRKCLNHAMRHFFWEIAEYILEYSRNNGEKSEDLHTLGCLERPFSHWIAHGSNHVEAIRQTIAVYRQYNLPEVCPEGYTYLELAVCNAAVEANFLMLEELISNTSSDTIKSINDPGSSAIMHAIGISNDCPLWERTICTLLERYTIEELNEDVNELGTYLHHAVRGDSVVVTRVLLKRGVNINKPLSGALGVTPLHECMTGQQSPAMYSLLVKYGAAIDTKLQHTDQTPLQLGLIGIGVQSHPDMLDLALGGEYKNPSCRETLHNMLPLLIKPGQHGQDDDKVIFRHVLRAEVMANHLNDLDAQGATLIQKAAFILDLDSVRVLLEAGADAGIPLTKGESLTFPLQIACLVGRILWTAHTSMKGFLCHLDTARENAIEVATELLQWHQARGDDLFIGITRLHLASCMRIVDEVELLARVQNPARTGKWPGVDHEVTAEELMHLPIADWWDVANACQNHPTERDVPFPEDFSSEATFTAQERISQILVSSTAGVATTAQSL